MCRISRLKGMAGHRRLQICRANLTRKIVERRVHLTVCPSQVVPETMVTPALEQLRALDASWSRGCDVVEATVVSKDRMLQALPKRLVRDIDIHRDPRGHCAYNEKLGRLKIEYVKIALERAEALHLVGRSHSVTCPYLSDNP